MRKRTSITVATVEDCLREELATRVGAAMAKKVEAIPVRRDMVTLLTHIRDNKVRGTQSTGNMSLQAIRDVTARFVMPPRLDETIGDHTYRLRSEEDVWLLHYLRIIAEVGSLIETPKGGRWQLTSDGARFLKSDPVTQVSFMSATWMHRVNWLVAFPYAGMGEELPPPFPGVTLIALRTTPVGTRVPFEEFADWLVTSTDLKWSSQNTSNAKTLLRGAIARMVIEILAGFEAVNRYYRKEILGRVKLDRLDAFEVTPWGRLLLENVSAIGRYRFR